MTAELATRWSARILSVGLAVLFAVFAIGEGLPPVLPFSVRTLSFGCLVLCLAGLLAAWRYEIVGAALALVGAVGFYVTDYVVSGVQTFPGGWVFPLLLAAPLLYMAAALLERRGGMPHGGGKTTA